MTDLTPNHPAVLAALDAETCRARTRIDAYAEDQITQMLDDLASALTAALPHLTADDLRHTPAGRELMAEGGDQGAEAGEKDCATADSPIYLFSLRATERDISGYYFPRWDRARPLEIRASTEQEAITKAAALLPPLRSGWAWSFQVDAVTEAPDA